MTAQQSLALDWVQPGSWRAVMAGGSSVRVTGGHGRPYRAICLTDFTDISEHMIGRDTMTDRKFCKCIIISNMILSEGPEAPKFIVCFLLI